MAALNFPDALSDGQTFEADTGVIYVYQGIPPAGFWSATNTVNGQQNQDARYVQRAGDDMTGNLTFSTDKIQLKAQDGNAEFAGAVQTNGFNSSNGIATSPGVYVTNNSGVADAINGAFISINTAGTSTATIFSDGGAEFAGDVEPGRINVRNGGLGNSAIRTFDASGNQVFRAYGDGGVWIGDASNPGKIQLNNNGSATFAGGVSATNFNADQYNGQQSGNVVIRAKNTDTPDADTDVCFEIYSKNTSDVFNASRVRILADGSASFAGPVKIETSENSYFLRNYTGDNPGAYAGLSVQHNGVGTAMILADGSASFNGRLNVGTAENRLSQAWGLEVYGGANTNGFALYKSSVHTTPSAAYVLRCNVTGVGDTVDIRSDGSAVFAGTINSANYSINLEPDNAANYTTTTDSEGNETQVYNGPTLDVKERLSKADAALQTLKTASAAAADFAALKSAIATALADI